MMLVSSCLILIVLFFNGVQLSTDVGGVLLSNTVWTSSGNANPYYLVRDVQIPYDVTLTIQAGVEVRFDRGDFEIFVKGFLKIQGTASRPVLFHHGSVNDTKWMIKFQSTNLSQTSISRAIFQGPKRVLQTSSAPEGLEQNLGVLLLQSVTFLNNATLAVHGKYADCINFTSPCPTVELRSSMINNSLVYTGGRLSEPIRIISSQVIDSRIVPRAREGGIRIINSTLKNLDVRYDRAATEGFLEVIASNVTNMITSFVDQQNDYNSEPGVIKFQRSTIRNASFLFESSNYVINHLIFNNSILNSIRIDGASISPGSSYILYEYRARVLLHNCGFTLGNIVLGSRPGSLDIRNSILTEVNLTSINDRYSIYDGMTMVMFNSSFQKGSIKMPHVSVSINRSAISLLSPPIAIGPDSTISCSSIVRSPLIPQLNTTGIDATDLQLINSSIGQFQLALRVNQTYLNKVFISNSNFESNSLYNIDNVGPYKILARGNWWGTTSLSTIKAKFNDYWDNIYFGEILFANYSSSRLLAERSCPR